MLTWMRRLPACALIALLVAGCGEDPPGAAGDAAIDAAVMDSPTDDAPRDGATPDVTSDAAPPDLPLAEDAGSDAQAPLDAPASDRPQTDATADAPRPDVAPADAPTPDAAPIDRPVVTDAPADRPTVTDAPAADAPRDVPPADAGCAGAAPSVTVTAPAANEMIETCTNSGMPVYYDFRANVTATPGVRGVVGRWRAPDGAEVAPTPPPLTAPPYVWRRQVGGMMVDVPPLAIIGGALRGTWHFEVTATDACGRSTTASQPFTLVYTTRRCPNP